jgi:hypothetical protein
MSNGKPFLPGRGRRSIGDAPGSSYGEKWHQQLDHLDKPKVKTKPKEIRIVGGVYTLNQHYIKFQKKTGGMTGYYELCINFDPNEGVFKTGDEACCPICRDFTDPDLPDELRMYGTFRYYADAFDIDKVKAGSQDGCFGVIWTNKYGKNDWVKISGTLGGDVFLDDLDKGCSVFWYYDENAKDNKEKMSFMKGEPLRVLYNEKLGQYGIKTPKGVFTGTPTDYASIIQMKSAQEIERDLHRLNLYSQLEEHQRATKGGYHAKDAPAPARGGSTEQRTRPPAAAPAPTAPDEDFNAGAASPEDGWGGTSGGYEEETAPAQAAAPPAQTAAAQQAKRGPGRPKKDAAPAAASAPAVRAAAPVDDGWGASSQDAAPETTPPPDQDFGSFGQEPEGAKGTETFGDGW